MKRLITAVALIALLPVTAQQQRPYFSLNTNRTFAPGEAPSVQMWAQNVKALDFRIYKVKDPAAFFARLENAHQFGQNDAPPERKELTWIEQFNRFKRRVRGQIRNAFRVQYTPDNRAAIRGLVQGSPAKSAPAARKATQFASDVPVLNSQQLVAVWRQEITTKQRWESQSVPVNVKERGVYLVEAVSGELRAYTIVMVTNLVVITKSSPGQILAYAVDRTSGDPVNSVPLITWSHRKEIARTTSGSDGLSVISLPSGDPGDPLVLARNGDDVAVNGLYSWNLSSDPMRFAMGYVYTDRPIYRPGHTVHWKSIMRAQTDKGFQIPSVANVRVEITDPEGKPVHQGDMRVSGMGTASGDFTIPREGALGYYSVEISSNDAHFYGGFHVEEYRKPEYEVRVTPEQLRILQGQEIRATISARYFFGEPVARAKVTYVVHRSRYWPWFLEEEEGFEPEGENEYGGDQEQVLEKTAELDSDGKLQVTIPTEVSDQGWDMRYRIEARVTDASNREIAGYVGVVATHGSFVISAEPGTYVSETNKRVSFRIETRDYDGKPVSSTIHAKIERHWPQNLPKLEQETESQTDANGVTDIGFTLPQSGSWRLTATAKTPEGRTVSAQTWVWVTGTGASWGEARERITLVPDKKSYKPGETAKVLIVTGVKNARVLVTAEGNSLYSRQVVRASSPAISVDIPIRQEYSPNFFVSAAFVKDNKLFEGSKTLKVPADDKKLQVEVVPSKPEFKPGEPAIYSVTAKDFAGKPVRAEVSLGVVDEAIYAIRPETGRDIFSFFYGNVGNRVGTMSSMSFYFHGEAGKRIMPLAQFGTRRSAQLKPEALVQPKVRKAFPDTAFWAASLTTDANGRAQARFEFPDSLTTWRATARAVTAETAVGASVNKTIVRKNLILRLSTPRFFTQGDEVTISALVHNYLKTEKAARVSLDVAGAEVLEGGTKDVTIPSNGDAAVNWRLRVSNVRETKIVGKALTDEESDAMELTLPVNPFGVKLATSKTGTITDESGESKTEIIFPAEIEPTSRTLEIGVSPSVGGTVFGALEFLTTFPYGCTEQTMSSFLPNVIVSQAIRELNVPTKVNTADLVKKTRAGIDRLYDYQHEDGGWGWWQSDESHPFMTAYVVSGLAQAKAAGYAVNEDNIIRGRDWLIKRLQSRERLTADQRAYIVYAIVESGTQDKAILDSAYSARSEYTPYGLAVLGLALQGAGDARTAEVAAMLESSAKSDERDAYWNVDRDDLLEHRGDSSVEATAFALKFLTRVKPQSPLLGKAAYWLVSHRDQGYYWQSTKQTATAVFGLTEYMKVSKELNPDYTLTVSLNGKEVLSRRFTTQDATAPAVVLKFAAGDLQASGNRIQITKSGAGRLYWSARGEYYSTASKLSQTGSTSLNLSRDYFKVVPEQQGDRIVHRLEQLGPDPVLAPGDVVAVRLDLTGGTWNYLLIEDPIPAGAESIPKDDLYELKERPSWWQWSFARREFRDDRTALFQTWLQKGHAQYFYLLKIVNPGKFRVSPARVQPMYQPQYMATSDSRNVEVK